MKRILLTFFIISVFGLSFFAGKIFAEPKPVPPPGKIPCSTSQTENPDFSSDRPYQASPCGDAPKIYYCGNTVQIEVDAPAKPIVREGIAITSLDGDWNLYPDGNTFAFNVSDAQLPVLGNTELIKNSQTTTDQISDATSMNEYVSNYLRGVNNRLENGADKNTNDDVVNLSGPVQKLLPSQIQDAQRAAVVQSITKTETYINDENLLANQTVSPSESRSSDISNHNQIIACAKKAVGVVLPTWLSSIIGIGSIGIGPETPINCYPSSNSKAVGDLFWLKDWYGENSVTDLINGVVSFIAKLFPNNDIVNQAKNDITRWKKNVPPLPWGTDISGVPFTTLSYQKAYNEWEGQLCIYNPLTHNQSLICTGTLLHPLLSNPYADLYPYIPLSNTIDKSAVNYIYSVPVIGEGGTQVALFPPVWVVEHQPILMYAHTLEDVTLTKSLNQTFTPKTGSTDSETGSDVEPLSDPTTGECRLINAVSNPGDNLFASVPLSEINVYIQPNTVHVTRIPCHVTWITQTSKDTDKFGNPTGKFTNVRIPVSTCQGTVAFKIQMLTKVPYAQQIFDSTVAGADSTFRRIYPKVGPNAPVTCIANTPVVSNIKYTQTSGGGTVKIFDPDGANITSDPKIYFPFFGSVYNYFLKGIQTALRPQGYADPTPLSGTLCIATPPTDCSAGNVPDSSIPSKYLGAFKSNFLDLANRWTQDCPGPQYNLANQCYNYVVTQSLKAGVNPAFTLAIWLHESDASNYCHGGLTTQDFGINVSSIYQNVPKQLSNFLDMAKQKLCDGTSGFPEPIAGWLSRFQSSSGSCNPADTTALGYYPELRDTAWEPLTNCVKNGIFGITWPTDMSCP